MGSNKPAVVAIIKYVICLTKAKFTDNANVEITFKKKGKKNIYCKTRAILYYGTLGILQAGMNR